MRRREQKAKLEELYRQIEELENVNIEDDGFWKPKHGDTYWYVDSFGYVKDEIWHKFLGDDFRFNIGNVFKTEEEARFEVGRLQVMAELKRFSCKFIKDKRNWTILFFAHTGEIDFDFFESTCSKDCNLYFESERAVREAVEVVGEDRIKKYLFGIEEF